MVKAMVGGCCVCSDERGWDENPLVYCDGHGCNVAVHQACYGIVQVPKGPWFCRKCESQERIARVKCELCPSKTGALKRTDTGGWAHVVCALYIPEVRFGNVATMEPIILASVPHERYLKMCYICEERGKESKTAHGGCMNCNKPGCRQTFHVTCAQSCGFLCEENDGQSGHTVKYVGYCQFHWNKRNKGLLNIKTPEKEKLKPKWEKDKKPKPRTSSESQPLGSQTPKPDSTPKSSSSTGTLSSSPIPSAVSVSPTAAAVLPGTPKPRGRKPSTVKTLPANSSASATSSTVNEMQAKMSQEKESPGVVLSSPSVISTAVPPVPSTAVASFVNTPIISSSVTTTGSTNAVFAPIPTTASKNTSQVSSKNNVSVMSNSVTPPTPPPPPVSVSTPVSKTVPQPKPAVVKKTANQVKNSQGPRKRPSSKTEDEPKRKVGRPPLKNKGESKTKISRPASTSKLTRPASTPRQPKSKSQNKSQQIKSPVITSPTPVGNLSSSYPGYPLSSMAEMSSSSLVSAPSGMPPSSHGMTPYVIPQPHLAGQLENGYSQESNRRTTNGPLQLPSSLEQLLEYQWEQGAQFLMQQASQYDVASLMSSLHQLKADNTRLENRLDSLMSRRSQLLQVSSRLSAPMSCTPTNTSSTSTDTSNKEPTGTRTTSSVTQSIPTATSTRTPAVSTSDGSKLVSNSIEKSSPSAAKPEPLAVAQKSQTPPSTTITTPIENKPTLVKTKNDKGKSPPIKVTTAPQNVAGTLLTVPITSKMVPQKSVNLQPSQIKVSMVQPHVTQGVADKDRTKVASTAPPIAILPTISSPLLQKQQLQLLQPQTKQITQSKTSKQPHILPHQTLTSQPFATQQFPQQQQFVLLMQQQQHLQQQMQRQGQGAYQSGQNQSAASQAQTSKGTTSQKYVPAPMSLGYQGGFVTISDGLGITGQPIDVSKATAFTTLPLVPLDKNKANDHSDKNGTASTSDKSLLKNS